MKELSIEEKAKAYDKAFRIAQELYNNPNSSNVGKGYICTVFPELKESEDEQNILFEELKALHLRIEHQTVCNDAGGNRMWRRAWQHINEAINIIKEDKETFKW